MRPTNLTEGNLLYSKSIDFKGYLIQEHPRWQEHGEHCMNTDLSMVAQPG
jgi:hypothetical protein